MGELNKPNHQRFCWIDFFFTFARLRNGADRKSK